MLCHFPRLTPVALAARRGNALKSTRPRTARSKARSYLSALWQVGGSRELRAEIGIIGVAQSLLLLDRFHVNLTNRPGGSCRAWLRTRPALGGPKPPKPIGVKCNGMRKIFRNQRPPNPLRLSSLFSVSYFEESGCFLQKDGSASFSHPKPSRCGPSKSTKPLGVKSRRMCELVQKWHYQNPFGLIRVFSEGYRGKMGRFLMKGWIPAVARVRTKVRTIRWPGTSEWGPY
jgi:hypothetical protein